MKLFHLADLHLGKMLNGFSMLDDQVYVLESVLALVQDHRPRAVILAGDVYDKPVPPTDAVRALDQFITALSQLGCAVFVISGNHDSPERLGFGGQLLGSRDVHIAGPFDGTVQTVTLTDAHGEVCFSLLPFVRPATVRRHFPDRDIERHEDAVRAALETVCLDEKKRNVLIAHQFMTAVGIDAERSESELILAGGLDNVDISVAAGFDYVALGHLHNPQCVGRDTARYAGSLLKYAAAERAKSMPMVELGPKGAVTVTLLPLVPRLDFRRVKGPLSALTNAEIAAQGNPMDYLHVTLTDEEEQFDAMGKLRAVYPNLMVLDFENSRTAALPDLGALPAEEESTPYEQFAAFFLAQNGREMTQEQAAILAALLQEDAP